MPFQSLLVFPDGVKYVDLSIIHGHDNVFVSQMKTCDDPLVWSDMLDYTLPTLPPCRLDHILVSEM